MRNSAALAATIHEAYRADGGPVRIHVGDDGLSCVEGQGDFFKMVGGYFDHDETTGVTRVILDAPGAPRIYS